MSSHPELRLDWCSHEAAKYAVEHWHYSGVLPTPPLVKVGVWECEKFIGCVLFSRGANNNIGKAYGLAAVQIAELTRVALTEHRTPVSRVVRVSFKFLKEIAPGLRLVVSYADPGHGHDGGIYKAGGWLYVGKTSTSTEYIGPDGKQWHRRMVSASGRKRVYGQMRKTLRHDECVPVAVAGKHKYLYPLDAEMRERIAPLAKPYPKRAVSIAVDAPAVLAGEGGSSPTTALH